MTITLQGRRRTPYYAVMRHAIDPSASHDNETTYSYLEGVYKSKSDAYAVLCKIRNEMTEDAVGDDQAMKDLEERNGERFPYAWKRGPLYNFMGDYVGKGYRLDTRGNIQTCWVKKIMVHADTGVPDGEASDRSSPPTSGDEFESDSEPGDKQEGAAEKSEEDAGEEDDDDDEDEAEDEHEGNGNKVEDNR